MTSQNILDGAVAHLLAIFKMICGLVTRLAREWGCNHVTITGSQHSGGAFRLAALLRLLKFCQCTRAIALPLAKRSPAALPCASTLLHLTSACNCMQYQAGKYQVVKAWTRLRNRSIRGWSQGSLPGFLLNASGGSLPQAEVPMLSFARGWSRREMVLLPGCLNFVCQRLMRDCVHVHNGSQKLVW